MARPTGPVTRTDVRTLVDRVGDGEIPFADIYRQYEDLMTEQGREPVTRAVLGTALRNACQRPISRGGVAHRVIRKAGLEWLPSDQTPE